MATSLTISKLSKLQRHILSELVLCRESRPCAMLCFFGFPRGDRTGKETNGSPSSFESLYLDGSYRRVMNDSHSSDPKYRSAMASISRAIARLIQRGLVKRRLIYLSATVKTGNTWIWLTEAGIKAVNEMVNEAAK
jgi:hypothetical protein